MKTEEMIEKVLISEEEIQTKVRELGAQITRDYQGKEVSVVCVLNGAAIFACDLVRRIDLPLELHFMGLSSYGNSTTSSGRVHITRDLAVSPQGKHIVIAEDVVDSGNTLKFLVDYLKNKGAASVDICAIFDKPSRRVVPVEIKYKGFEVPNEFIIGYGLDYAEHFRNLPYLGILKREVYEQ